MWMGPEKPIGCPWRMGQQKQTGGQVRPLLVSLVAHSRTVCMAMFCVPLPMPG